ncbi:MAG TPA: hybrid sensor histidine kinase/response regulator [Opitutaceae bacterium]|jgi:two-component system sensor histidine kinase/response regulator
MSQSSLAPAARILVVDDQESNVQVVGNILGQLGFEIMAATTGEMALRRLAARSADLVLLDLLMPGMDGLEVCRRMRAVPGGAELPVIFLSADDDKNSVVRALEAGGVDYVTKPFNPSELITRVRTHLALKGARDRLKQLAEDKDELLGILAHDLKNHLGGMQMSAQLLNDRANLLADPRLARMAGNILNATTQMSSFVHEFLANSSADRGLTLKVEALCLSDIAAAAAQQYQEAAQRKELTLIAEIDGPPVIVAADRAALDQVLGNLVSNALKFSPSGKRVWLSVESLPFGGGSCRVRDEGPGFTPEDRVLMFRRYRRLSARPTGGEPSTGLGLSIVKRLMEGMHGTLSCESTPGEGATFTVTFPAAPPSV